jgi:hypothetical protein
MKAIAFSFGTAAPLIVIVIPEGGALDAAQLPGIVPEEPPVATPDEPLPLPLPEDGIAPVDATPLDGRPVVALEPVDGGRDPDVNPVPLLVPLLVPPLAAPLGLLASNMG